MSIPKFVLATLFFLLWASGANAITRCVSTPVELQQALSDASNGGRYQQYDNIILVVKGTYAIGSATGNRPFTYASSSGGFLHLLGGYDGGCHQSSLDASDTVLDGNQLNRVLVLDNATQIEVRSFTIQQAIRSATYCPMAPAW